MDGSIRESTMAERGTAFMASRSRYRLPIRLSRFFANKGAIVGTILLLVWILVGLLAPSLATYDPLAIAGGSRQAPGLTYWMGTDLLGRDMLSRIIFGSRISLTIGFLSVSLGLTSG